MYFFSKVEMVDFMCQKYVIKEEEETLAGVVIYQSGRAACGS